jgi:hypothetical protein
VCPQPFLENDEAEEDFMVIVPAGSVLLEKFAHGARMKVLIDPGVAIEEGLSHPAIDSAAEPVIYDIDREPAFRTP